MKKLYRYVLLFSCILSVQMQLSAQPLQIFAKPPEPLISPVIKPSETTSFGCGNLEGGYASRHGVYQGEEISFYVSTNAAKFTLNIYRYGKTKELIHSIPGLTGGIREVKEGDNAYVNGCNWPVTAKITIPGNWRAGAYLAEFPVQNDTINPILFFVKEKDVSKRSKVIVVCATSDYHAYNMFGGKSAYNSYSSESTHSVKLSFNRPYNLNNHNGVNRGSFFAYDAKLIKWLEDYGYGKDIDVIGSTDLDEDPEYLYSHKVLLDCGHDEYWSRRMREHVEEFVNRGGHFMCLSGNTCWWQVRFEDNYRTMICYKHFEDPISDPRNKTKEWYRVQWETPFLGTSYVFGGQANYYYTKNGIPQWPGCLTYLNGYGGYIVHNSQHWVYKNSGMQDGDTLGFRRDSSIVGYEADGTLFKFNHLGIPVSVTPAEIPAANDVVLSRRVEGTGNGYPEIPQNFRILGLSPVNHISANTPLDWATMGIFKYQKPNAGFVFNAATIRWVWGLYSNESQVSIITKNVLDRFLNDNFPPEFVSWSPSIAKPDMRFGLPWQFNSRNRDLPYGKNLTLRAEAKGYYGENVSYAWAVNDSIIPEAKSNLYFFRTLGRPLGRNKVTAFAFNDKDTVTVSWQIKTTESALAIISIPDTVIRIGQPYRYALNHYSKNNLPVTYSPDYLPKWAKFDPEKNVIEGIPNCLKDSICVTAVDQQGNTDTQGFALNNYETTYVKNETKTLMEFSLYQNYPNPFNGSTRIRFNVKDLSSTELTISNLLGRKVRTYSLGKIPNGPHEITWDGNDDFGKPVSSGIYFYQVSFNTEGTGTLNLSKKMIYMK